MWHPKYFSKPQTIVLAGDCLQHLGELQAGRDRFALTFLDPPFNQGKDYKYFDDNQREAVYWSWLLEICQAVYDLCLEGAAIYFIKY
ncbi:MAG: hypothetical protein ACK421_02975 [Pseudanabaenaceae cyanobacterium]